RKTSAGGSVLYLGNTALRTWPVQNKWHNARASGHLFLKNAESGDILNFSSRVGKKQGRKNG
ncbi:MAG: hypothetical protein KBF91_02010, partial [Alphaproteobacteria bacterium]|nr:hypothetical protein [Alphaproteobacteria bacterium]